MLIHCVYFKLKPDIGETERAAFREGVEALKTIRHAEAVYVGGPAPVEKRPVCDDDYDVGLAVVLRDTAAHDAYQADPVHTAFLERFRSNWERVRVFDFEEPSA